MQRVSVEYPTAVGANVDPAEDARIASDCSVPEAPLVRIVVDPHPMRAAVGRAIDAAERGTGADSERVNGRDLRTRRSLAEPERQERHVAEQRLLWNDRRERSREIRASIEVPGREKPEFAGRPRHCQRGRVYDGRIRSQAARDVRWQSGC